MHHGRLFRLRRRYPHSAQAIASLSISEWGMRSGFDEQARRAPSSKLRKYDARCCIIFTEGYRSGHNEAVLKTVWAHAHKGSNPFPSAI